MQRVVVTGGSGFVGSHLAEALSSNPDYEVISIDNLTNYSNLIFIDQDLQNKIKSINLDISDYEIVSKFICEGDIVFHLAAQSHVDVSFSSPAKTLKSNILGTHAILEASRLKGIKKLVIMSTDEVYGPHDQIKSINTLDPSNPYSASKAAADMIVNSYKYMYEDLNISTLRSNNIIGERQFIRNIFPRFICQTILGRKITLHGDGSACRRYLWVKDVVNALLSIAENGTRNAIYNIGHPDIYSNLEVAKLIQEYLNVKDNIEFTDDRIFNDSIYPCDNSEIEAHLGWKPSVSVKEALPIMIGFYQNNINYYSKFFS